MEYLKQCLQLCCKKCIDDDRKDSNASTTKIILPPSRRGSVHPGSAGIPSTYTFLAQPSFRIPNNDEQYNSLSIPLTPRRKQSSPTILMSAVPVQMSFSSSSLLQSVHSMPDPTIYVEDFDENWNQKPLELLARSDSVPSVNRLTPTTPTRSMKRLSLSAGQPGHSRRSSMSSFDISKEEVDSDLYDSCDILPDANSNGRLCFTVNYDKEFEQLTVKVLCAKSLWQHDASSPVHDSYVKVSLLPPYKKKSTKTSTAVQRAAQNPTYDETFVFDKVAVGITETISLKLTVCTFDKSSRKKKLGSIIYHVDTEKAHKNPEAKIWRHLYGTGMVSS